MRAVTAVLAFAFAIYVLRLSELDPPHAMAVPIIGSYVLVPLGLGLLAGWWALPLVAASSLGAAVAYHVLVWTDDPELTGINDFTPVWAIVLVLPGALLLVAFGAALRQRRLDHSSGTGG